MRARAEGAAGRSCDEAAGEGDEAAAAAAMIDETLFDAETPTETFAPEAAAAGGCIGADAARLETGGAAGTSRLDFGADADGWAWPKEAQANDRIDAARSIEREECALRFMGSLFLLGGLFEHVKRAGLALISVELDDLRLSVLDNDAHLEHSVELRHNATGIGDAGATNHEHLVGLTLIEDGLLLKADADPILLDHLDVLRNAGAKLCEHSRIHQQLQRLNDDVCVARSDIAQQAGNEHAPPLLVAAVSRPLADRGDLIEGWRDKNGDAVLAQPAGKRDGIAKNEDGDEKAKRDVLAFQPSPRVGEDIPLHGSASGEKTTNERIAHRCRLHAGEAGPVEDVLHESDGPPLPIPSEGLEEEVRRNNRNHQLRKDDSDPEENGNNDEFVEAPQENLVWIVNRLRHTKATRRGRGRAAH